MELRKNGLKSAGVVDAACRIAGRRRGGGRPDGSTSVYQSVLERLGGLQAGDVEHPTRVGHFDRSSVLVVRIDARHRHVSRQ